MAENTSDPARPEPDAAAAEREKIEAYLSSAAWKKRLDEARVRREKVLTARRAGDEPEPERPEIRTFDAATKSAAVPLRAQPPAPSPAPAIPAPAAPERRAVRRSRSIGGVCVIAGLALGAVVATPAFRPLGERLSGIWGGPARVVEAPEMARFDSTGGVPPASPGIEIADKARVAEAPLPPLSQRADADPAPSLARSGGVGDLDRSIPVFPPQLAAGASYELAAFPSRRETVPGPAAPTLAPPPAPDAAERMAALSLPGLALDDPAFPPLPTNRGDATIPPPDDDPALTETIAARLAAPDADAAPATGEPGPHRPAARAPHFPTPPDAASAELPADLTSRPDARPFPVYPAEFPFDADLALGASLGNVDPHRLAARFAPSPALMSMPWRAAPETAAPSPPQALSAPRLLVAAPGLRASAAPEGIAPRPVAAPAWRAPEPLARLTAPARDPIPGALGESAVPDAADFRLSLQAASADRAAQVHDRLIAAGFTAIDVSVTPFAGEATSVYYFHRSDEAAARELAERLGGEARSAVGIDPSPGPLALDIHVGG